MDSLIILKLLPRYLFIDSVLAVNPWGRGGAAFFTATFSLVPKRVFQQISGLKTLSKLQGWRETQSFCTSLLQKVFFPLFFHVLKLSWVLSG